MNPDILHPVSEADAWGTATIFDDDPAIEAHEQVYYVPYLEASGWGMFDREDRLLVPGVDKILPEAIHPGQSSVSPVTWSGIEDEAPDDLYIYAGRFNPNYGHFLVDALSRYWWLQRPDVPRAKILVHHPDPPAFFRQHPELSEYLLSLGLGPEDFAGFDRPTRVRRIILPWTSFGHQTHAHRTYRSLALEIGRKVLNGRPLRPNGRPAYLSKSRLPGGIRGFLNEREMEPVLESGGVEVLHPHTMSLQDKIALFAERPILMGMAGSAFHHSVFAPEVAARLVMFNPRQSVNSNFLIFDRLSGADSRYFHAVGSRRLENGGSFYFGFELEDPPRVARALLELV